MTGATVFEARLADRPDVLRHLQDAHSAARDAIDARLYDLVQRRVETLLGSHPHQDPVAASGPELDQLPQWPTSNLFSEADRACLAFVEQFVIDVAAISDDQAAAVVATLGDEGFSNFVHTVLVIEQRLRLALIWQRLFDDGTAA